MWADKFLQFFRVNKSLSKQHEELSRALDQAQGRILTLQDWNKSLQEKNNQLEQIIFRRFGLIPQNGNEQVEVSDKPIIMSETWRTAQAKLQDIYRKGGPLQGKVDDILDKQNKYWDEKLKAQEEESKKKVEGSNQEEKSEEQTPESAVSPS